MPRRVGMLTGRQKWVCDTEQCVEVSLCMGVHCRDLEPGVHPGMDVARYSIIFFHFVDNP
jgi:hypothetical protein